MNKIYGVFARISKYLAYVSGAALCAMILFITVNVILRKLFSAAIYGSYEMTEMAMAVVACAALAFSQSEKAHVHVTILMKKLPGKLKFISFALMNLIAAAVSACISAAAFSQIGYAMRKGLASGSLRWPMYPFYTVEGVCLTLLTILLILDTIIAILAIFREDYAAQVQSHWV